jgi:exopolysaccharide production protein ExoQ
MPPIIALLLGFAFIAWLMRMDMRWREMPSKILWIPAVWLALSSSRNPAFWLSAMGFGGGSESNLEGSPINVIFNGGLFVITAIALNRRSFSWSQWVLTNKALFVVFAYFLASMLWSEFPIPTVKRLVQEFGTVLIAAVFLTESDPKLSVRVVFARVSYILFPLSVVFMRYFPHIGRNVSTVSGAHMVSGVADHKNSLGQLAMVFLLVLLWDFVETRKDGTAPTGKGERWARYINFGIGIYLLFVSESATSLMCFLLGLAMFFTCERLSRIRNAKQLFMLGAFSIVFALILNQRYGLTSQVSMAMGRGENLSGRRQIWEKILEKETNPMLGHGFRGFWETDQGMAVWQELEVNRLLTSHNGYLEIYVQGGLIGLFLLAAFLWSTGLNAADKLVRGDPLGRLGVIFWPILLIYNATESAFLQVGVLWFAVLIVTWPNSLAREEVAQIDDEAVSRSIRPQWM